MTNEQYQFLSKFNERLIQPIIDKLDADQQRNHPVLHGPFAVELASVIRSLKIEVTSHASFSISFVCKGDHVSASVKQNCQKFPPRLEHSLWELYNLFELADTKLARGFGAPFSFPAYRDLSNLKRGIWAVLQIIRPKQYGTFCLGPWWD